MEHYRSVFATTAVMVIGLVASSPFMRAQDAPTIQPRANAVSADRAGHVAWTDPPRAGAETVSLVKAGAPPVPRPASFTLLPPEMAGLLMAGDMRPTIDRAERAQVLRRHRTMKVARRDRQPATGLEAVASQPQKAARIDSIGDLVRACLDTTADCSTPSQTRPGQALDGAEGSVGSGRATSDAS